jgi:hypothetical protein
LSDAVLKALAAKGGLVGIHGGAAVVAERYRQWMQADPEGAANAARAVNAMVEFARLSRPAWRLAGWRRTSAPPSRPCSLN